MEYEEIKLLKQSDKSTVQLIRGKNQEGRLLVRKVLKGKLPVYQVLRDNPHPCLPKLYEVSLSEDSTTVVEEYIEGQSSGAAELDEKQFLRVVRELCSVLEFLHGKGVIHRDIKPSNLILTQDGHIFLIDFDAARMPKEETDQDTRRLGTRGFAPPEQYGFAQTDERADIYAMGATLEKLMGEETRKPRYRRILRKCMNLDPDKRYQSAGQVKRAFFHRGRNLFLGLGAFFLLALAGYCTLSLLIPQGGQPGREGQPGKEAGRESLIVLQMPGNPHWDGETGIAAWGNVPEAGIGDELQFHLRLYKRDTETPPDTDDSGWYYDCMARIGGFYREREIQNWNLVPNLEENGFYFFSIAAAGDGISYADSPYVMSGSFEYTGESAPLLPVPTGLAWRLYEVDDAKRYYAAWSNLDDYEDKDAFNVTFYDETGAYVTSNIWTKGQIVDHGRGGIPVRTEYLISEPDKAYRFTVQVYSSRPNEYRSSPMPEPAPEEYYSPWLYYGPQSEK